MQKIELEGIIEDTAQVVGMLLPRLPGDASAWDKSYHAANAASAFLDALDDARFAQGQPELCPHVVASPDGCLVRVFWNDEDIILDFSGDGPVVVPAEVRETT